MTDLSRRDMLKWSGAAALATAAGGLAACQNVPRGTSSGTDTAPVANTTPPGAHRLVHFTDSHIRPEYESAKGTALALEHARNRAGAGATLMTGGDLVMDAFNADRGRTMEQWNLWNKVLADGWKGPVEHCIGNHDIWGWSKSKSKTTGSEPQWGKKWWMEVTKKTRTYGSFERGPWHVVVLDSIQPYGEEGYEGRIDDEQFEWLKADLAAVQPGRYTLVVTHIPVLTLGMIDCDARRPAQPGPERTGLAIGVGAMLMDCHKIIRLFQQHKHVKACLSGHIHIVEHLRYAGIEWFCSGAVSGMWWRGMEANREFMRNRFRAGDVPVEERPARADPGYAVVDLMPDGRVQWDYVTYGWQMKA